MRKIVTGILLIFSVMFLLSACTEKNPFRNKAADRKCTEIIIENITLGQEMPDLAEVETAVNAITEPAIQCKIHIENVHIADHDSWLHLKFQQKEPLDLINTGRTLPLTQMVNAGYLLPLDELLEQYGSALLEKNKKLWNGCKVNQQVYMVPASSYCSAEAGFLYNAQAAGKLGIEMKDQMSMEEIEKIAALLKEQGIYLLSQGKSDNGPILSNVLYPNLQYAGSNSGSYGVLLGEEGSLEIRSLFETEEYLQYCKRLRRWEECGWIPSDSMYSGKNVSEQFRDGEIFMTWSGVSPLEFAFQAKKYDFEIGMFSLGKKELTTSAVQENGWGIAATSKNPEKAMELLNFLYENSDVANLLMNGLEGKEYQKVSEHIITTVNGMNIQNLGYSRSFSVFGDQMQVYQWEPMKEEDFLAMPAYYEDVPISPLLGYTFDSSAVSTEIAAVNQILNEYLPPLECGLIEDVEGAVMRLNQLLKDAGMDTIIRENQRQLAAWLEADRNG